MIFGFARRAGSTELRAMKWLLLLTLLLLLLPLLLLGLCCCWIFCAMLELRVAAWNLLPLPTKACVDTAKLLTTRHANRETSDMADV